MGDDVHPAITAPFGPPGALILPCAMRLLREVQHLPLHPAARLPLTDAQALAERCDSLAMG